MNYVLETDFGDQLQFRSLFTELEVIRITE